MDDDELQYCQKEESIEDIVSRDRVTAMPKLTATQATSPQLTLMAIYDQDDDIHAAQQKAKQEKVEKKKVKVKKELQIKQLKLELILLKKNRGYRVRVYGRRNSDYHVRLEELKEIEDQFGSKIRAIEQKLNELCKGEGQGNNKK